MRNALEPDVWIAAASVTVAMLAFILTCGADARSHIVARTQMYVALKTRFLQVHEDLSPNYADPNWEATDPKEIVAVQRYWYHALDEWYVSVRLNNRLMRPLWDDYYSAAILGALRHNGLRHVLIGMTREAPNLPEFWQDFRRQVDELWKGQHPSDGATCRGIECDHIDA